MKSLIGKWRFPFLVGFIGILSVIVSLFVAGKMSPQEMGYAFAVVCVAAIAILTLLLSKTNKEAHSVTQLSEGGSDLASRRKILRTIIYYKVIIAAMLLLLVYAWWSTTNDPLFPRIVGAVINIAITGAFIIALKAQKAKLR